MNEEMLFQQMNFIRNRTIALLDATPVEILNEMPKGFNNNLLWNYGHIFVAQEYLLFTFLNEKHSVPPTYRELFNMGSTPKNWNVETPSLAEIRSYLVEQPKRMMETFSGRLEELGEKPFVLGPTVKFKTLGEVLGFANFHEGVHQGTITSLKRALGVEDLWTPVESK
jgi:hypothetical protein